MYHKTVGITKSYFLWYSEINDAYQQSKTTLVFDSLLDWLSEPQ